MQHDIPGTTPPTPRASVSSRCSQHVEQSLDYQAFMFVLIMRPFARRRAFIFHFPIWVEPHALGPSPMEGTDDAGPAGAAGQAWTSLH